MNLVKPEDPEEQFDEDLTPDLQVTVRRYRALTIRVLNNMISAAHGDAIVYRTRAKYSLTDIPAALFDTILEMYEIKAEYDTRTRARYYNVKDIEAALEKAKAIQQ